jgi:hypothetical protein
MILTIQNYTKVITTMYHSERFVCTYAVETPTNYRFQFRDDGSPQLRILWIEVSRLGVWDANDRLLNDGGNWTYRLNYLNQTHSVHIVTAEWFGKITNVMRTFRDCLEKSL